MKMKDWIAVLASASALAACGAHATAPGPLPAAPAMPSAAGVPDVAARKATALLVLSLEIPRRNRGGTHVDYISAGTQSIKIDEGKATIGAFNTTPTTKGCLQQSGSTLCTYHMGAISGKKQLFIFSTYDAPNQSGHLLSTGTVRKTIAASKQNTLKVTLNGVPAALSLVLSNSNPTQGAAVGLTLTVNATDADGNTIISPGNYANSISLADSNTSVATLSATTVTSPSSNVVDVTCTCAAGSATFTASAKGVTNATATLTSVKPHSEYVGGVWAAVPGFGSIPYFDNAATPSVVLNGGGLTSATAVAVDDQGGVIAGDANGNIEHWPINAINGATPMQSLTGAGNVSALTWDPINERVIYAAENTASFCVVSSGADGALGGGNQTCYSAPSYPLASTVSGLAVDQRTGNLYVANATAVTGAAAAGGYCPQGVGGNVCISVLVFTPSGTSYNFDHYLDLESPLSGNEFNIGQIAFDPTHVNADGSTGVLWTTDQTPNNDIVRGVSSSSTGGNIPYVYTLTGDGANLVTPATVAWDGSGGLWAGDRTTTWLQHWTNVYTTYATVSNAYYLGAHDGNASPTQIAVFNVYTPPALRHTHRTR
jgi:hypothetical protein